MNNPFIDQQDPNEIMQLVFGQAKASGLFPSSIIKVRIIPFEHSIVDGADQDLMHIVAWIMGGRTTEQKKDLADRIVTALGTSLPELSTISIDVRDIDPPTYSNRELT